MGAQTERGENPARNKTRSGRGRTRERVRVFSPLLFAPPAPPLSTLCCVRIVAFPSFLYVLVDIGVGLSGLRWPVGREGELLNEEESKPFLSLSLSHHFFSCPLPAAAAAAWSRRLSCRAAAAAAASPRRPLLVLQPQCLLLLDPLPRVPCPPAPRRPREGGKRHRPALSSIVVVVTVVDLSPLTRASPRLTTMTRRRYPPTSSEAPPSPGHSFWSAQLGNRASTISR